MRGGKRAGAGRKPGPKNPELKQAVKDVTSLAKSMAEKALKKLEALLDDPKATAASQATCAIAILDRAYGKPPQLNTNSLETFKAATEMTDAELAQSIADIRAEIARTEADIRAAAAGDGEPAEDPRQLN